MTFFFVPLNSKDQPCNEEEEIEWVEERLKKPYGILDLLKYQILVNFWMIIRIVYNLIGKCIVL